MKSNLQVDYIQQHIIIRWQGRIARLCEIQYMHTHTHTNASGIGWLGWQGRIRGYVQFNKYTHTHTHKGGITTPLLQYIVRFDRGGETFGFGGGGYKESWL